MPHIRTLIRDEVTSALTGLATTGARVFKVRKFPAQEDKLPCLCIYTPEEASGLMNMGGANPGARRLGRTLQVIVHAVAKASDDLEDVLDQMCLEVETALANPPAGLKALIKDISLQSTQLVFAAEGKQPLGNARMVFTAHCQTTTGAPAVAA